MEQKNDLDIKEPLLWVHRNEDFSKKGGLENVTLKNIPDSAITKPGETWVVPNIDL